MDLHFKSLLNFLDKATLGQLLVLVAGIPLIGYMIVMIFAFGWKSRPVKGPDRWYIYGMISYLMSFLWIWLSHSKVFVNMPAFTFFPINFLLWLGPIMFQFIKSKLYVNFRFTGKDLKHFILPIAHLSFYVFAFCLPATQKYGLYTQEYHFLYKPLEEASFGIIMFLYCYFAYRFIKHEQWSITSMTPKPEIVKISWLRRFFKLFFLCAIVHLTNGLFTMLNAFFIKINFETNYLELLNIFVLMVCMGWLGFHAVIMKALPKP